MSQQLKYIVALLFMVTLAAAQTANAQSISVELAEKTPPADPGDLIPPTTTTTTTSTTTTLPTIPRCPARLDDVVSGATASLDDSITRDFVFGADGTFLVDLPNGTYTVTPTMGDKDYSHGPMAIYANDQLLESGIYTNQLEYWNATYTVSVTAGRLALRFLGPTFVLNGLQIQPVPALPATQPPPPSSGILFDFGPPGSPVADGAIAMDTAAYNPSLGYGWVNPGLFTRDRGGTSQNYWSFDDGSVCDLMTAHIYCFENPYADPTRSDRMDWESINPGGAVGNGTPFADFIAQVVGAAANHPETCFICGCYRVIGCFPPGVKITMADGSLRNIEDVRAGDLVGNAKTGDPVKVGKVIEGPEALPLLRFGFVGTTVTTSQAHPVLTAAGLKPANQLKKGDTVFDAQGNPHPVTILETLPIEEGQRVINVNLEAASSDANERLIISDGIITGDIVLQGLLKEQK